MIEKAEIKMTADRLEGKSAASEFSVREEQIGVEIVSTRHYAGPNVHALFPVMEVLLDLGDLADAPSNSMFATRLKRLVPPITEHRCSKGYPGGFLERLKEGTYPAHIIEHTSLAIQNMLGFQASFGNSRVVDGTIYRVVVDCEDRSVAEDSLALAVDVLNSLHSTQKGSMPEFSSRIIELQRKHSPRRLGPSTRAILEAASQRNIPHRRMDEEYSLFSLGWGVRQKKIWASVTSETSAIACDIGKDKALAKRILENASIPVPRGFQVASLDDACKAAEEMGWPVLVKPVDGHHGQGVMGNLCSFEEVKKAVNVASHYGSNLLVEEFLRGEDYRALVVDFKVAAVAKRTPAHVTGDGFSAIRALVDRINLDPDRGTGHESFLTRLRLDEEELEFLASQGISTEYIPSDGEIIFLRSSANLSTGGTAMDVTSEVHPKIIAQMERAARLVGLDVAGVDLVTEDITRPLEEVGGAIVEINAGPGLRMHLRPSAGKPKPVADIIVQKMFPEGNGRIPLVSITGTNGKTTTSRMVEHIASGAGYHTGMAVTGGIYINGDMVAEGDTTGPWSARMVLDDSGVDFAILETARGGLLKRGMGFDRSTVGAVLNIGEDHFGVDGIDTLEDIFWVKSLVVEAVEEDGYSVINAEDKFAERLMERARGHVVLFSARMNDIARKHAEGGGRVFLVEEDDIVLLEENNRTVFSSIHDIPCLRGGVRCMTENTLAAAAISYSTGISLKHILMGIKSFECDTAKNPGRLNVHFIGESVVLLDYAHNPGSIEALGEYARTLGIRTRAVFTAPGDRNDALIKKCGEVASKSFDELVITESHAIRRGRTEGEIATMLAEGASSVGGNITVNLDRMEAASNMLLSGRKGDVLVLADLDFEPWELEELLGTQLHHQPLS